MKMSDFINEITLFGFESIWLKDEHCEGVIKNTWESIAFGSPMDRLTRNVHI